VDPSRTPYYRNHYQFLLRDLAAAERLMEKRLSPYKGRAFLVFHAAFGRFAEAAGLRQLSIEAEGKDPSPRRLEAVLSAAKRERIRTVFVEPQFDRRGAEAVARALGGRIETLDPLARDPIRNLAVLADAIANALAREDGRSDEIR
jgi:zinc transport system substrate-binding protein